MDSTEEDLIRPIFKNGRYQNPFDTWEDTPGMGTFLTLMRSEDHSNIPSQRVRSIKEANHDSKSIVCKNRTRTLVLTSYKNVSFKHFEFY